MKKIALILLMAFGIAGLSSFVLINNNKANEEVITAPEEEGIKWLTIEEAYKLNKKKPKKIFVDVYTDWCGWCKRMDKTTFADPKVVEFANKNYYAVKLNAESAREMELDGNKMTETAVARTFRVGSYPTIVFIEKDFKTIYPMPGYRDATAFLDVLKKMNETDLSQKSE